MTDHISRAAVLEILRTPAASDTFHDMIRRVEALEGCGVRVKALEWEDFEGLGAKASGFYQANYLIQKWSGEGRFEVAMSYPGYQTGYDGPRWHPTLKAAKAAAQADYEARILAALEPVAQPETGDWPKEEISEGVWAEGMGLDAAKWAAEFRKIALRLGYSDMDEGWLIGWFANAIEYARRDKLPSDDGIAARLAALRETFCYASPGSDAEFTSLLLGFDTAAKVIQECACEPGTEPTPGQFATMCLAIEDVITGRGFDVDPWQPIETAPENEGVAHIRGVWVHNATTKKPMYFDVCPGYLEDGGFIAIDGEDHGWRPDDYSHWMPLPQPPGETTSAIPEVVKAYLRNALMVAGWHGERE